VFVEQKDHWFKVISAFGSIASLGTGVTIWLEISKYKEEVKHRQEQQMENSVRDLKIKYEIFQTALEESKRAYPGIKEKDIPMTYPIALCKASYNENNKTYEIPTSLLRASRDLVEAAFTLGRTEPAGTPLRKKLDGNSLSQATNALWPALLLQYVSGSNMGYHNKNEPSPVDLLQLYPEMVYEVAIQRAMKVQSPFIEAFQKALLANSNICESGPYGGELRLFTDKTWEMLGVTLSDKCKAEVKKSREKEAARRAAAAAKENEEQRKK
jgi:hypothetical protein